MVGAGDEGGEGEGSWVFEGAVVERPGQAGAGADEQGDCLWCAGGGWEGG